MNISWISASATEASAVKSNGDNIFLANVAAIFIKGPTSVLNKDPRKPPNWIIKKFEFYLVLYL